jgi:hypothetical protein
MNEASHYAHSRPQAGKPILTLVAGAIFPTADLALTALRRFHHCFESRRRRRYWRANRTNREQECQKAPFMSESKEDDIIGAIFMICGLS